MSEKNDDQFELTELFLVKADWDRTFTGTIKRERDEDGQPIVRGAVKVNGGMIYGMAENEKKLRKYLNQICIMKLDMGLHYNAGVFIEIVRTKYFLN